MFPLFQSSQSIENLACTVDSLIACQFIRSLIHETIRILETVYYQSNQGSNNLQLHAQ